MNIVVPPTKVKADDPCFELELLHWDYYRLGLAWAGTSSEAPYYLSRSVQKSRQTIIVWNYDNPRQSAEGP